MAANDDLDFLFAETADDDARRAGANRAAKRPVFHAGDSNRFTPFKDIWNSVAADLGITTKRMKEDALAQAAADEAVWRDTSSALSSSIAAAREGAANPEDLRQLATLDKQLYAARRLAQSSNPKMQEAGIALLGQVAGAQRAFDAQQEVDAIKREADEREQRTLLGDTRWNRFTSTYGDLHKESSTFLAKQAGYGALIASYSGEGEIGNANDVAAINSLQRMIDPGVSVREGDVSLLQNLAGVPDILITGANRVMKDGGRFTPEERRAVVQLGKQLMAQANGEQSERNARFQGIGIEGELPEGYVNKLSIPLVDVGGAERLNFGAEQPENRQPSGREDPASVVGDTVQGVGDIYSAMRHKVTDVLEGLSGRPWEAPYKRRRDDDGDAESFGEVLNTPAPPGAPPRGDPLGMKRGVYVPRFLRRAVNGD